MELWTERLRKVKLSVSMTEHLSGAYTVCGVLPETHGTCLYIPTELEAGTPIINWSSELVDELGGYLYPLWNRTAGDCLLDSVLQATWGVVDRDGTLRRALADSLVDGASL